MNLSTIVALSYGISLKPLIVMLLNARSMRKHEIDVTPDEVINNSGIILFTEIQIAPGHNTISISLNFKRI